MKRTPLLRKSPLKSKSRLVSRSKLETRKPLLRLSALKRSRVKQKAPRVRTAEQGGDADHLAFVRLQPCCACGAPPPNHAHHEIFGGRGKSQKAPDRRSLAFCAKDHADFHAGLGRFRGWTREQKRDFQDIEISRLLAIKADVETLGVWQEPDRIAV